jgi:hypothetical protein
MSTKAIQALLFLLLIINAVGCSKSDNIPEPVSYTVLIYMAADNSMESEVPYALQQIKSGMKKSGGTTVVFLDSRDSTPRLFEINRMGEEIPLKTYPELNSASAETLAQIIADTKQMAPNTKYGLVMWSHAMGWLPMGHSNTSSSIKSNVSEKIWPNTRYCGADEHPGDGSTGMQMLEIDKMADALPDNAFEYILFDVCLMGNIESLYQLKRSCNYLIASPTEVLAEASYNASGFPYEAVMPKLFGSKNELTEVCQLYYGFYNGKSGILRSASVCLIDTHELDSLYRITQTILTGKLTEINNIDISTIQVYHTAKIPAVFFDLKGYIQQIATTTAYQEFTAQLNKTVIYKASTDQFANDITIDKNKFSGLSTYIPLLKWKNTKEYNYYFQSINWSDVYY